MTTWDLGEFLERTARHPVELELERQKVKHLLTGRPGRVGVSRGILMRVECDEAVEVERLKLSPSAKWS